MRRDPAHQVLGAHLPPPSVQVAGKSTVSLDIPVAADDASAGIFGSAPAGSRRPSQSCKREAKLLTVAAGPPYLRTCRLRSRHGATAKKSANPYGRVAPDEPVLEQAVALVAVAARPGDVVEQAVRHPAGDLGSL